MPAVPALLVVLLIASQSFSAAQSFEQIAKEADAARASDRVNDAIRLYQEAVGQRPSWGEGWWSLGSLLYDQDRFSEAEAALQHFVTITPKPGPAYALLGLCEYEMLDYDRALAHFRAWARAGWPGTPQLIGVSVFRFALLLTRDGKFTEALYLLASESALGNTPSLSEAMGLASLRMQNLPENYPPERREMFWLAGEAALYAAQVPHDYVRADAYADRLVSHYRERPEVHYFRATLFIFENNSADAEHEFREELRISPQHVPAMLGIANIDLDGDQLAEAATLGKRSTESDPKNPDAHHLLGRVLMASGNFKECAGELELAKKLAPDSAVVRSHLAMVYGRLGRLPEAQAEAAAFLVLKKQEEVLAPPQEKIKSTTQAGQPK